ncbi:hypothetical protein AAFH68_22730 [Flavobacterium sp. CGRL1]
MLISKLIPFKTYTVSLPNMKFRRMSVILINGSAILFYNFGFKSTKHFSIKMISSLELDFVTKAFL